MYLSRKARETKGLIKSGKITIAGVRKIKIELDKHEFIGDGYFATCYKLDFNRIVKVYNRCSSYPKFGHDSAKDAILDEARNSTLCEHTLPVEEIVRVALDNREYWGLIKRYIKYPALYREVVEISKKLETNIKTKHLAYDASMDNMRKDRKGKVWLVDTQTIGDNP